MGEKDLEYLAPSQRPSRRRRSAVVADRLQDMILKGELNPGDQLPSEADLCREFGVSRVTLREATQILKGQGFLVATPGRGTFVSERDPRTVMRDVARFSFRSTIDLADVAEVREVLERRSATQAAERGGAEERQSLLTFAQGWYEVATRHGSIPRDSLAACDREFHLQVAALSRNVLLEELMERLVALLEPVRRRSLGLPGRAVISWREHIGIAQAIADGDGPAAGDAMAGHVNSVYAAMLEAEAEVSEDDGSA